MKDKKRLFLIITIIVLIAIISITVGISYSFVYRNKLTTNTFSITTSNLSTSITYTSYNTALTALSDEDGLAQSGYGVINISKNNPYSVFYNLEIGYSTSLPSGYTVSNLMPLEYVKVALYSMSGNTLSSTPVVGPVALGSLPTLVADSTNAYNNMYNLSYNTFAQNSDSAKYAIKVWIDENTPVKYDGYLVYLSLGAAQETKVSKSFYNISGTVKNSSNAAMTSGTVYLHNGTSTSSSSVFTPAKATISSSGAYTLYNVPTGTYNLSVVNGSNKFETTIHVEEGSGVSVVQTSTASGSSNDDIRLKAYTYYTTPKRIIDTNNLLTSSNEHTTTSYTIPSSYIITGLPSLDTTAITGVNLTCSGTNITVSK